ncbi:MAG: MFS transporter [Gammaproteobacteria bacterium]|nr:MFS transporter [Gammaproteobacteria bacterium]
MQSRANICDSQFANRVMQRRLPAASNQLTPAQVGLSAVELVDLFESQLMSRHLDLQSRSLALAKQSFYTIGSSGHEGNVVIGKAFRVNDMAFLHYRSGALMIQRSKQLPGQTPLYDMLLSFVASSDDPISGGRHKVLGSKALFIPPQTSTIASHLPKAVGAAYSIPLASQFNIDTPLPNDAVILCNFGDASTNHSTAQGAINTAAWISYQHIPLPLVFLCEDNGIGISTPTPSNWIHANFSQRPGLKYFSCDGLDLLDSWQQAQAAQRWAREYRQPVFLHMKTVRLFGHAGSDTEIAYRDRSLLEADENNDPLLHSARILLDHQIMTAQQIISMYQQIKQRVARIAVQALSRPKLTNIDQVKAAVAPAHPAVSSPDLTTEQFRQTLFKTELPAMNKPQHMARLLNWTLADLMAEQPNIFIAGEDVCSKGGVYGVTKGLFNKFGKKRLINTLLDEQSILGLGIGAAHNGFLPIIEIQFLAYVHNAEDQIRGEAATLPFFSNGQFSNPMVIRIAGLGYQKGFGGHFHNDNSLAVFRDIPGLVIACPSNGRDASEMLRAAVNFARTEQRVVIFIEPIALYMTKDLHQTGDGLWSFNYASPRQAQPIKVGEIGVHGQGNELAIVSYGNGFYLSCQAAKVLEQQYGICLRLIDLRWLAPLDETALMATLESCEHVLVVDECRATGSFSEQLLSVIYANKQPQLQVGVLCGEDCFVPLAGAATFGMPSKDTITAAALKLLGKLMPLATSELTQQSEKEIPHAQ